MDGIRSFILERPYPVRKDGTDWIYTAAVHCLYKESTMSIPQLADDAQYNPCSNAMIYHDEYEVYFQFIDSPYIDYNLTQ